ncbi:DUF2508 domain-containing protein [Cohnella silvisoli]|uniref:DUF2508 domain-containing protein n=1 Tax=Cohnella silvisoli TaxID=2873699 RepID=A0ABV1L251_9BACL|nr:DUF2508 domain-containing protein [Cohnella silvisoli]MCD9025770.1 DUF2508 domain-containing protein [Cohnella silvisoli]
MSLPQQNSIDHDLSVLDWELEEAHKQFLLAWHHFEQAGPEQEFVDAAIYKLCAAEKHYSILFVKAKSARRNLPQSFRTLVLH